MKKVVIFSFLFIFCFNVFSQTDIKQQIKLAEELYSSERYDEALQLLDSVILRDPDNMYALMCRSCVHDARNDFEKALVDINKVIEYDPGMLKARHIRGGIFCNIGNYEKAIEEENFVLEKVPSFESGLNVRGLAYGRSGMYDEAVKDFTAAISVANNENSSPEIYLLNRAYVYYFKKQYDKCMNDVEMSLLFNQTNPEALVLKSKLFRIQNNYKESIKWVTKAISYAPDYLELYYLRILNYLQVNDLTNAKNDLDYIEPKMRQYSAFHSLKALYYYHLKDQKSFADETAVSKELKASETDSFYIQIETDEIKNEMIKADIEVVDFK